MSTFETWNQGSRIKRLVVFLCHTRKYQLNTQLGHDMVELAHVTILVLQEQDFQCGGLSDSLSQSLGPLRRQQIAAPENKNHIKGREVDVLAQKPSVEDIVIAILRVRSEAKQEIPYHIRVVAIKVGHHQDVRPTGTSGDRTLNHRFATPST